MKVTSGERLQGKDAGLAESNGSIPPGEWLEKSPADRLPIQQDQLQAQWSVTNIELYLFNYRNYVHLCTTDTGS